MCGDEAHQTPEGLSHHLDRSGEVFGRLKFPRDVMPNIMRPSFQNAAPSHEVKAIPRNVLVRVSIATLKKRRVEPTASGRSIPGRSMGRKWTLGYKGELSNRYGWIRTLERGTTSGHTWKISLYSVIQFQFHHWAVYSWTKAYGSVRLKQFSWPERYARTTTCLSFLSDLSSCLWTRSAHMAVACWKK